MNYEFVINHGILSHVLDHKAFVCYVDIFLGSLYSRTEILLAGLFSLWPLLCDISNIPFDFDFVCFGFVVSRKMTGPQKLKKIYSYVY